MNAPRPSESGMTLVETLISLFLIALIATGGSAMLIQSLQGARTVDERGSEAREMETLLAILRHDLEAFTGRPARTGIAAESDQIIDGRSAASDGRVFAFVRNGWADPGGLAGRSDLQRVEYIIERGALIRRSWSAPDPGPATPMAEQRLIEGVESFAVRYGLERAWRGDWSVDRSGEQVFPDKVEMTFRFGPEDEITARFRLGQRG